MNKTHKIIVGLVCLFVQNLAFSQQPEGADANTVVMTEGELTQLVQTIAKHRKENVVVSNLLYNYNTSDTNFETTFLEKRIEQLQWQLQQNRVNKAPEYQYAEEQVSSQDLQQTKDQINDLRQRLYAVEAARTNIQLITPNTPHVTSGVAKQPATDPMGNTNSAATDEMIGFTKKLDSLQSTLNAQKSAAPVNYQNDFNVLKSKLGALQTEMAAGNAAPSNYELLKSKYKGYKQEFLFDNNDTTIKGATQAQVDALFNVLHNNDNLDVVLKGFASAKGNAAYNEKLSMERTESIKRALVLQGTHPTRVLTQYHGIDYKAVSAATARRVEATILVRK